MESNNVKFKLRQLVTTKERAIRYQILRRHRDGTVTMQATFKMQENGRDVADADGGYIGNERRFVRIDATALFPADYAGSSKP